MIQPGRAALPQAFFLPVEHPTRGTGQRFCLFHLPQGEVKRGRVLYLHPFAEEINTTRRIVAQQARAMAEAGFAVLQMDLMGCGDSSGEFSDASWSDWVDDALMAQQWLTQFTSGPSWLWGMRSGALLATELLPRLTEPTHLLLWQPVASGQQMLQQFIRLHTASQWLGSDKAEGPSPTQLLAQGQSVEIAGYLIKSELAKGLSEAVLRPIKVDDGRRLVWLEVSNQPEPTLGANTEKELAGWRDAGWQVHASPVQGPAFWQNVSADNLPNLLSATLAEITGPEARPNAAPTPA